MKCQDRRNRYGGGITRRSDYRVLVTGLPKTASWQDLKDHMRKAGDVTFAQARLLSRSLLVGLDGATCAKANNATFAQVRLRSRSSSLFRLINAYLRWL